MRMRWVLAAAVAFSWGCRCEGAESAKRSPLPTPGPEEADAPSEGTGDAKRADRSARFQREREGFIKAKIGDKALDFRELPAKSNRVTLTGKPSLLVVDALATDGGTERLQVRVQGVNFAESKGRAVARRGGETQVAATVAYVDPDGKTYVGRIGRDVQIDLGTIDEGTQTVDGKFSGKLVEQKGEGVLEVTDGEFKTALAGAGRSAADAPP